MRCTSCQADNREGIKFCENCGVKMEMQCPECRVIIPLGKKYCGECGRKLDVHSVPTPKNLSFDDKLSGIERYIPTGLAERALSQRGKIEGERRQVTVMFVDMKGFTRLTDKLGPEETFNLMNQLFEILIHKVHDYEGTVNKLMGDGLMALFGVPVALEDAPQRAIRSSLSIHRDIKGLRDKIKTEKEIPPIQLRIGINTGPVVVGTLRNDLRVQFTAVGNTINMAARMEQLAAPGTTYVTEDTFKLTEGLFRFEALGKKVVKGKKKPLKVYQVIAPSTRRTRFDVSAERGLTPFVGRDRELEILLDGFQRAKSGKGQAFSITAEAGAGKSRLLYEFRKAVANEKVIFLEGKCLSYSHGIAYHPVIGFLKSNFDIKENDKDSEIKAKVNRGLKMLDADEDLTLPYFLELLSVKDSGIDEIPISPEARKNRIIQSVRHIVLKGSQMRLLIIAIEDLHWIDSSSEDILKDLLDNITGKKVFLIFTYRPEFVRTWNESSYHSRLNLNRLSNRESISMATYLLGKNEVDTDIEDLIIDKTEGIPFFIEEFVRTLKDLKIIEIRENKWFLTKKIYKLSIPSTIQDVIMSKIDSLPEKAKMVLQKGSVIEREFSYELLKRTTGISERNLLSIISTLKDSELIYERGIFPNSTYIFKHALIHDVAYQSLLKSSLKREHQKIATVLEKDFPEVVESYPEVLGHHYTEAGFKDKAIPYWQEAGEIAIRRSANREAISHLRKALLLLETCQDLPQHARIELDLQIMLGPALMAVMGYTAPEVEKIYARAKVLCQQLSKTSQQFNMLRGLWGFYLARCELQTVHQLGQQCFSIAQRSGKSALLLWAHLMMGQTLFHLGDLTTALDHFKQSIALYDFKKRRSYRGLQNPGVACLSYIAVVQWLIGYPNEAFKTGHKALLLSHNMVNPFNQVYALNITSIVSQFANNVTETSERAETANAHCDEHGGPFWLAWGHILHGWAITEQNEIEKGISEIQKGLASLDAMGTELVCPYFLSLMAKVYSKNGQIEEGLSILAKAFATSDKTGERWWESELHRLKGELLLSGISKNNQIHAETCFHHAIDIARRRQLKSLELRSVMSLSRLLLRQGKRDTARQLLNEIYDWFTEGFDTPDLQNANIFLRELT